MFHNLHIALYFMSYHFITVYHYFPLEYEDIMNIRIDCEMGIGIRAKRKEQM